MNFNPIRWPKFTNQSPKHVYPIENLRIWCVTWWNVWKFNFLKVSPVSTTSYQLYCLWTGGTKKNNNNKTFDLFAGFPYTYTKLRTTTEKFYTHTIGCSQKVFRCELFGSSVIIINGLGIGIIIFDACFSNYLNSQTIVGERTDILFFLCCLNNKSLNVLLCVCVFFSCIFISPTKFITQIHYQKNNTQQKK